MSEETKTKIIEAGAKIIQCKGFNNTGLQEILEAAQVPKGSFYFYFKNKEDFGLQVIDYFYEFFCSVSVEILNNRSQTPIQRLKQLLNWFLDFFRSQNCTCGCPIGNLSQEMADINPAFREKLKCVIEKIVASYSKVLKEAQERGEIPETQDVEEVAWFIVSSCHGALIHMKVEKSLKPLENWNKFITEYILRC